MLRTFVAVFTSRVSEEAVSNTDDLNEVAHVVALALERSVGATQDLTLYEVGAEDRPNTTVWREIADDALDQYQTTASVKREGSL